MTTRTGNAVIALLVWAVCTASAGQLPGAFDKAMALFRQEKWSDAAAAFSQIEIGAPGTTDALLYEGKALARLEHFNEAAEALESYINTHPTSADGLYCYGYVLFRQDRPKESIKALLATIKVRPPSATELITLALDYSLLDDTDSASSQLENAVALSPGDYEVQYQLGRIRYRQSRLEEAIKLFGGLAKRDPTNVRVLVNLGLSLETNSQPDAAAEVFRKAIEVESSSKQRTELPYLYLGRLLVFSNKTEEAIALMRQGLVVNPRCYRLHSELGRVYFTLKRMDEAQAELEEAVRLYPRDRVSHYFLARLFVTEKQKDKAEEQFQIAKELTRTDQGEGARAGMGQPMEMPPQ